MTSSETRLHSGEGTVRFEMVGNLFVSYKDKILCENTEKFLHTVKSLRHSHGFGIHRIVHNVFHIFPRYFSIYVLL
jgi:hypothetical protein